MSPEWLSMKTSLIVLTTVLITAPLSVGTTLYLTRPRQGGAASAQSLIQYEELKDRQRRLDEEIERNQGHIWEATHSCSFWESKVKEERLDTRVDPKTRNDHRDKLRESEEHLKKLEDEQQEKLLELEKLKLEMKSMPGQ
jgi:hypothetical protein